MKKLVLLTLAATVVAGSAFAAAPVTKISDGSTKVCLLYTSPSPRDA